MTCTTKRQPKKLRVGATYHLNTMCEKPVLYLGYFRKETHIDGLNYYAGWQFLPLGWYPATTKPTDPRYGRSMHQPKRPGLQHLLDRIHIPDE